jgi:hypothetical protein
MLDQLNTVDLSAYLTGSASPDEARALAESFVRNAKEVGFFYVQGWESVVSKELVQEVFDFVRPLPSSDEDDEQETLSHALWLILFARTATERALLRPAAREEGCVGVHVEQGESGVPFVRFSSLFIPFPAVTDGITSPAASEGNRRVSVRTQTRSNRNGRRIRIRSAFSLSLPFSPSSFPAILLQSVQC